MKALAVQRDFKDSVFTSSWNRLENIPAAVACQMFMSLLQNSYFISTLDESIGDLDPFAP